MQLKIKSGEDCEMKIINHNSAFKTGIILLFAIGIFAGSANAQLTAVGNRVNYFNSENLTVVANWGGTGLANITVTLPSGINFSTNLVDSTSVACANESAIASTVTVICNSTNRLATFKNVSSGSSVSFTVKNYTNHPEYRVSKINVTAVDGASTFFEVNVSLLKIKDQEVFNTLVEYGRGRGNYFYSTTGGASSAGTGTGYPYLPNGTKFELNYLHKIYNVKQYFGLPTSLAYNATWACTYPNNSMVRVHLANVISRGALWNLTYKIEEVGGSFERQGYMGEQFDASETSVVAGTFYEYNCTGIRYYLPDVNGNISVPISNFTLQMRDPEAMRITARPDQGTIGSGTSEVLVEYNISNNEIYPIEAVTVELQAPTYGTFIGTRGELFGTAQNKYIFKRERIPASTTEQVFLVVRFNTTGVSSGSTDLFRTTVASFVPTWEANAYNPLKVFQTIPTATAPNNITIDSATSARIVRLQDLLVDLNTTLRVINNTVSAINTTVNTINATVNSISTTVNVINDTTTSVKLTLGLVNSTVTGINTTVNLVNNTVTVANTTANTIDGRTTEIKTTANVINSTVNEIRATVNLVNNTVTSVNITVNLINGTVNRIENTATNINTTVNTISSTVNRIETVANLINNTVTQVNATINTLNDTVTSMKLTLLLVNATTANINTTVNLVNNTVTNINSTANTIDGRTTEIKTTANVINSTANEIRATVNLVNNTVTSVNFTVNLVNGTTNAINQTTLAINVTTNSISLTTLATNVTTNSINSTINTLNVTATSILHNQSIIVGKINRLQEFDEELVFLVTDSFGLRDQAAQQATDGDMAAATESLRQANEKLAKAVEIVSQRTLEAQGIETAPAPSGAVAVSPPGLPLDIIAMISILALMGAGCYVFMRRRSQSYGGYS